MNLLFTLMDVTTFPKPSSTCPLRTLSQRVVRVTEVVSPRSPYRPWD